MLLMCTKNIDLVKCYTKKGYSYYIEFIQQILEPGDIKMNCNDALLFMYKKTIYEVNHKYQKEFRIEEDFNNIIRDIDNGLTYFNNILGILYDRRSNIDKRMIDVISDIIGMFNNITIKKMRYIDILELINIVLYNNIILNNVIDSEKDYKLINSIIELSKKKKINVNNIKNKIENIENIGDKINIVTLLENSI